MQRTIVVFVLSLAAVACSGDCGTSQGGKPNSQTQAEQNKAGAAKAAATDEAQEAAPEDVAAPPADAERSASGLAWKQLRVGASDLHPRAFDLVRIHYTAWTPDGKMFDSTRKRGAPAEVPLEHAIKGWVEGIPLMSLGEIRRFWVPAALAYEGRTGWPQSMLVFDIELIGVDPRPAPPAAPSDLTAPARATKAKSGLVSLVLVKGKGREHPGPTDIVTVHYSGWSADGTLADSSIKRGMPATFPLNKVIAGWREALQEMVIGEKRRLWIPANLAYQGREGPQGALVYELELLGIRPGSAPVVTPSEPVAPKAPIPASP